MKSNKSKNKQCTKGYRSAHFVEHIFTMSIKRFMFTHSPIILLGVVLGAPEETVFWGSSCYSNALLYTSLFYSTCTSLPIVSRMPIFLKLEPMGLKASNPNAPRQAKSQKAKKYPTSYQHQQAMTFVTT